MIRRIWADNFKSLRKFELELRPFNVLIGANASGKSNIVDLLRFLQDCLVLRAGVTGAVAKRDGWTGVTTAATRRESTVIRLSFHVAEQIELPEENATSPSLAGAIGQDFEYGLALRVRGTTFEVVGERLGMPPQNEGLPMRVFQRDFGRMTFHLASIVQGLALLGDREHLALGSPIIPISTIAHPVTEWQFLKISPDAPRRGTPESSPHILAEDGANLARLLDDLEPDSRLLLVEAMRRDVPGFVDFHTQKAGGKIFFTIDEEHAKGLPPAAVSDGTIRLLAIYTLFYGQKRPPLLCIEEPENGLHPDLIETVMEYLRAMSEETQVIITTHSPLLVDQCEPEEVILLEKVDGATRAMRVPERSKIQKFLEHFSLGELWAHDYLEELKEPA